MRKTQLITALVAMAFRGGSISAEAPATAPAGGQSQTRPAVHPVFMVVSQFLLAVDAGDFERARTLCVPDRFSDGQLSQIKQAFRLDQAKVLEARLGNERAVAVTDETPSRQPDRLGTRWGMLLQRQQGRWLIRDVDLIVDAKAAERYLREFEHGEPGAQKLVRD